MLPGLSTVTPLPVLLIGGRGPTGGSEVGRTTPTEDVEELCPGDVDLDDDLGEGLDLDDDLGEGDGAAVTLTELAAIGSTVIGGLVEACAVAVSHTAAESLAGTVIAACMVYDDGAVEVASGPSWQPPPPFPLGQSPLNTPWTPEGPAERLTHAEGTGP